MTKTMNFTSALAALVLFSGAALAQTAAPATPTTPPKAPPAATAPAAPAAPKAAAPAAAPAPAVVAPAATAPKAAPAPAATAAQTVNLNTATESDLDKLPQVGPARAKAIIDARTKGGKFKNWDDFVARNVVPKNAEDAIKTLVKF
jgi:competence protein ComEA